MFENNISLYCIKYAESILSENMIFDGGSKEKLIPISFAIYLIKTKDRNILVDAGCKTMTGFDMKKHYSPAFVLRTLGLIAAEITDVVITHAHHDHIEAVSCFENATIHICKEEYECGKCYIPDDMEVNFFESEYEINSQVKIIKWCGHSKGSAIVEIKANNLICVLAGDECYINANLKKKICTGTYYNKEKSTEFIKKYADKKYRVYTCHDISLETERII